MSGTENTKSQQRGLIPFKPGESGNPAGRPKGSRNKLAEDFVADMHAAWQEHGKQAILEMIADKPGDYVKTVASLIPKDVNLNISDGSEMTDEQLADRIRDITETLAPFLLGRTRDAEASREGENGSQLPARVH